VRDGAGTAHGILSIRPSSGPSPPEPAPPAEIPICALEEKPVAQPDSPPWEEAVPVAAGMRPPGPLAYRLPSTDLLNEGQGRSPYDEQELKDIAVRIKSKFEEFNVLGSWCRSTPARW
jgi:DNA segregation ATPase FtsK/SpoIIIE-like protein